MNNLTLIILVSFSVINILYLGSDLFVRKDKNQSNNFEECKKEEPGQQDCQKCNEFLNCKSQKNEKIVRKTKTSTKSKILGNGDLVEQTTVTEVTETIVEDEPICSDEATSLYYDCLESCEIKRKEEESDEIPVVPFEIPVVPFGFKPEDSVDNNDESINIQRENESKHVVEENKFL